MRNTQRAHRAILNWRSIAHCAVCLLLAACSTLVPPPPTPTASGPVTITVTTDGKTQRYALPNPMTAREALAQAGIALDELDRLSVLPFTWLTDGMAITIVRVRETLQTEEIVVPFTTQIIKSDTAPEGQRLLLQAGLNGKEEITTRTVFEDGVQVSRGIIKRVTLEAPREEIVMIGAQASFTTVTITGTLAYVSGNNAWIMRGTSRQRTPLTTTGDVDGRVFDLSANGQWLLFTRAFTENNAANFNTLWAITTTAKPNTAPLKLSTANVLYAEWQPANTITPTLAYSTADHTPNRAPGWQANNDVWLLSWFDNRRTRQREFIREQIVDANSGGVYGWWGTGFAFAPDGQRLAYARTDSIGVIDLAAKQQTELTGFAAFNTGREFAWYPALRWAEGNWLYAVIHGPPTGLELPEYSLVFDLAALSAVNGQRLELIPRAGMYANPVPSPAQITESGEHRARIAFLQASDPNNSPYSRYRLMVMDRDGSDVRAVFPPEEQPGLDPGTTPAWSPDGRLIAIIYQGNLWLVDPDSGATQQLTGDGLSQTPKWGR